MWVPGFYAENGEVSQEYAETIPLGRGQARRPVLR